MKKRNFDLRRRFPAFLFWSWNIIFLAFVIFGFAPTILPEMISAIWEEDLPLIFPITALILTLIPIVTVLIGFFRLRFAPKLLLALGYGVEGPLMLLIAIRFFVFRELNPAMMGLLLAAAIGMVTMLWDLLDLEIDKRGKGWQLLRLIGTSCLLLVGIYAAVWFAFYAVPLVAAIADGIVSFFANFTRHMQDFWRQLTYAWDEGIQWVIMTLLGMLLVAYTATLLIGLPIAAALIYLRTWRRALRRFRQLTTPRQTYAVATSFLVVFIAGFALLNRQPQGRAFELVRTPPTTQTAAAELLDQETAIRNGLLNAYLSPMRYVSADGNVWHVEDMYDYWLGLSDEQANQVERLYARVARPVLYKPVNEPEVNTNRWGINNVMQKDSDEAAELYARFFDEPIAEGEKEAIVRAAKATWNVEQAMNQWQMVDDREVHLLKQTLNVDEHDGWAEIELHEAYQNVTWQRQEVLYYFSLPESAVVTGLWLGNSEIKAEAFEHRVAPRGAAQAVYKNEVQRRTDPALLEQLGPTQYRLRIFPVEPISWANSEEQAAPPLYLWMNYRVLASEAGWATPQLSVKRNIFWDDETERIVNGVVSTASEEWLPAVLPSTQAPPSWIHQRVDFNNGKSVLISRFDDELPQSELNVAIVVDRSRSMALHEREVMAAVAQLDARAASVEMFFTAGEYHSDVPRKATIDEVDDILYFGGMNSADLLHQFNELSVGQSYDAVFVLTDSSGYELGTPEIPAPAINTPVWMIHFGGYPIGYDDNTLQVIQASGGGAALSVSDALMRMGGEFDRSVSDIVDGYRWLVMDSADVDRMSAVQHNPDLAPFAARRLILSEMVRQRANLDQVESLDQLHAIAVENSIVTPYSSMLVLVNERQHNLLDELENADDRFEREFEDVDDTQGIQVTGVPEPHEYVLMALAAGMLLWYWRQKRTAIS